MAITITSHESYDFEGLQTEPVLQSGEVIGANLRGGEWRSPVWTPTYLLSGGNWNPDQRLTHCRFDHMSFHDISVAVFRGNYNGCLLQNLRFENCTTPIDTRNRTDSGNPGTGETAINTFVNLQFLASQGDAVINRTANQFINCTWSNIDGKAIRQQGADPLTLIVGGSVVGCGDDTSVIHLQDPVDNGITRETKFIGTYFGASHAANNSPHYFTFSPDADIKLVLEDCTVVLNAGQALSNDNSKLTWVQRGAVISPPV